MSDLCRVSDNNTLNWAMTSDVNYTGRPEISGEEMPNNTPINGMTPSSFRAIAEMWIKDEFQRCDDTGCNGPLYPDHKPAEVDGWIFTPAQVGPATYDNIHSDDDDSVNSNTAKTTAVGLGLGLAAGAVAVGSKIFFGGTATLWTPAGWGLMIGGAVLVLGGAGVGYLLGKNTKGERELVNAGLDKSGATNWNFTSRVLIGEFVNLAQAGAALRGKNVATTKYIDEVKKGFEELGRRKPLCGTDMTVVEKLAPASMEEATITSALGTLGKASGDQEMADLLLIAYLAQKAKELASATPPNMDAARLLAEKARNILASKYLCGSTWTNTFEPISDGRRGRIARAVLAMLEEAAGLIAQPAPTKEEPKKKPAPFVPSLENCAKRKQEYNPDKNKCVPCGTGTAFSRKTMKCEKVAAQIECDITPIQMKKLSEQDREAWLKACR